MIFDKHLDIEIDIKKRISNYIKINNDFNIKELISLLSLYLTEMKNINEINKYIISNISENSFDIMFEKNNFEYVFNISLINELRFVKFEKIKNNVKEYEIIK
jgi:hypothetical protein